MRKYLNAASKDNLVLLSLFIQVIEPVTEALDDWIDKKTIARLKTANTHLCKAIPEIFNQLDKDMLKSLTRRINSNRVEVVPITTKYKEHEEEVKESVYTLASYAIQSECRRCREGNNKIETCELKKSLIDLSIPKYSSNVTEGQCPFKIR